MTTNPTTDGVSREAVAALEKARDVLRAIIIDKAAGVHYAAAQSACHQISHALELRALLDATACATPDGSACPGDGVGPCKKCPAAQPKGEPVAWRWMQAHKNEWEYGSELPVCVIGTWAPLYAEQPAPVAVVLPERRALSPSSGNFYARGWNACIDELKRLSPSL